MRISRYFKLGRTQASLDFIDVNYRKDVRLFLNPKAIEDLPNDWGAECTSLIQSFFSTVLGHIKAGRHAKAEALLAVLREPNETHLGLSRKESRGRALGELSARKVWRSLSRSKAATSGLITDLEDTALFIRGIGPDIISDITTNIIRGPLIDYTHRIADFYGIPLTDGVDSGPMWDSKKKEWVSGLIELPMTPKGKLLLVPKAIVRRSPAYNLQDYYSRYVITHLQQVELDANSALVHITKKKIKKVYKKDVEKKFGKTKDDVVDITTKHPEILKRYKTDVAKAVGGALSHQNIAEIEKDSPPDWDGLLKAVTDVKPGKAGASAYEVAVADLLTALLYPDLTFPKPQYRIHDGRKRIDIAFTNQAIGGFFFWLSRHHPSGTIFVECKNYEGEIANPELDQLAGRFGASRGRVGLLVSRSFDDKALFLKRCKDTAADGRGYIIALDDADLKALVASRKKDAVKYQLWPLLRKRFEDLVN